MMPPVFYRALRALIRFALHLYYRIDPPPRGALDPAGPVLFVANHPNGLIDPGMIFVLTRRQMTFLAKAPLFSIPVLGALIRALGCLPVYRRQEAAPGEMGRNDATLDAAAEALIQGRAITLFPEGKSHTEPQLAQLRTGAARIALRAARAGAPVRLVPVGLTYADRQTFRSAVRVEVGPLIDATRFKDQDDQEGTRALTEAIAAALRQVTINLERWEDLPLIETAEALYALRAGGDPAGSPERLRAFSHGLKLLRAEQPERLHSLRTQLTAHRRRLKLLNARPGELGTVYQPAAVTRFVLKNLAELALGLPLFALGTILFGPLYAISRAAVRLARVEEDVVATVHLLALLVFGPLWLVLLVALATSMIGAWAGVLLAVGGLPLALFTRLFYERRRTAIDDTRLFFALRSDLKMRLISDGQALAAEVERVAEELKPRVTG
jgi:glycerol-3-phosphate O-acyltransferase/dihydroxyacetone phosphate acyltransferase